VAARTLSERTQRRLAPLYRRVSAWPPVGLVRFGSLRRVTPISRAFGLDRGEPIDRYYIDHFLKRHSEAKPYAPSIIRGRVLEIGDARYAKRFGDPAVIERIDVLDVSPDNPRATIICDLSDAPELPSEGFDCVICTQTLLLIYDLEAAVKTLHRILKPGGTLLATVPGISPICRLDMDRWGDFWRFTELSLRRLLEEVFHPEDITVGSYGNVLTATAFLHGLTVKDLKRSVLEIHDPNYQLLVTAKAVKAAPDASPGPEFVAPNG
jgi:SAM-dependent methyltransferase